MILEGRLETQIACGNGPDTCLLCVSVYQVMVFYFPGKELRNLAPASVTTEAIATLTAAREGVTLPPLSGFACMWVTVLIKCQNKLIYSESVFLKDGLCQHG